MSTARHHVEWLSLLEVSGPFLSLPVLLKVFPQGLDAHEPDHFRLLREVFEEWEDNQNGTKPTPAIHRAWIRYVLTESLGFPDEVIAEGQDISQTLKAEVPEHAETLRPDLVIVSPEGGSDASKARLLIQVLPAGQGLEKPLAEKRWKASPATRMMELLHATGCLLGLLTNGEQWMLVYAPKGETTGFASWYASLWFEEQVTLRAFRTLLSVRRFFGVAEAETLEGMLVESSINQQEVTDQLGYQVREAVEVVVRSLDHADQDHGRKLLPDVTEEKLYEAALTVMMRLVFLFSAEERGLLLLGDPLYDQHYAVSTLQAQLREAADRHGEEVLERRHDAWSRLLATFRAVHGGVAHDRLRVPAYGGHLFDPDRFPFLEGRKSGTSWRKTPATPLPIDNRTVLHLLEALQYLRVRLAGGGPAERRRVSFRALDIEQIGHVYEGLLDHTAKRAGEPVLGLSGAKDKEPEVPLSRLEQLRKKGEADLIEFLREETGRSEKALKKALTAEIDGTEANRFRAACGNDNDLWKKISPFAGLIRDDTFGHPVIVLTGSVYVTAGTDRRSSGTHYTPASESRPIVQYTLEPLVYEGPAEGWPKEKWKLRPAKELLELKICDMASGSGALLVQACRYMSERLVEAWEQVEAEHPEVPHITPEGLPSKGLPTEVIIPKDANERLAYARRLIAQRCLYGVDKNPLAVEMAKLSLWLLTLAKDMPFTFLDHAIRHGDSLLGVDLEQLKVFNLDRAGVTHPLFAQFLPKQISEAIELRRKVESITAVTVEDVERQEELLRTAEDRMRRLKCAADLLIAADLQGGSAKDKERLRSDAELALGKIFKTDNVVEVEREAKSALSNRPTFHWPLEFPEVFVERGGFDGFISNPPFLGGLKLETTLGPTYREHLVHWIGNNVVGNRGTGDLCAYFFLRAYLLLQENGQFGFLATNTIAQGDTRRVGLDQLAASGCTFPRAVPSRKWVGTANIEVAHVWVRRGSWLGPFVLQDNPVAGITPFLTPTGAVTGNPYRLAANAGKSFQGSIVLGMGFILTPEEAQALIAKDRRNHDVLSPYLNGEDLNSRPDQSPSRWVINFHDWPLEKAETYPDCMRIVREKVKPERDRYPPKSAWNRSIKERWWRFAAPRFEVFAAIAGMERVLVTARVSKDSTFSFSPVGAVFSDQIVVFAYETFSAFALMQSNIHIVWAWENCSTMRSAGIRYAPSDAFDTFARPATGMETLEGVGREYYEARTLFLTKMNLGLTKFNNRSHNPEEASKDIAHLRELHVEMDKAVTAAYGWTDIDLGHGFHTTKHGIRFTISEPARREVLTRLLKLNHERHAEEEASGLTGKKGKKADPPPKKSEKSKKYKGDDRTGTFEWAKNRLKDSNG